MTDTKQIDWAEEIAYEMTKALVDYGILSTYYQDEQLARVKLANILRERCAPALPNRIQETIQNTGDHPGRIPQIGRASQSSQRRRTRQRHQGRSHAR